MSDGKTKHTPVVISPEEAGNSLGSRDHGDLQRDTQQTEGINLPMTVHDSSGGHDGRSLYMQNRKYPKGWDK